MKRRHMSPHSKVATQQLVEPQFKGLCTNCEKRHTCKFPRPKGGVLFCDEYE